jgi:16S rRNA C967 or C1407 C5-methylase (RsmB/RsmF family)
MIARKMAQWSAPREPRYVTLWMFPREDHPRWLAERLGELEFDEYRERIRAAQREFEAQGLEVRILYATVEEVLQGMQRHGLENTPEGRAAAYGLLYMERLVGGAYGEN